MTFCELRLWEAVFDAQVTGPDRATFDRDLRGKLIQQYQNLVALLIPGVGHDLYAVGEALADLSDLDHHTDRVYKVLKKRKGGPQVRNQVKVPILGDQESNVAGLVWCWDVIRTD